MSEDPFSALKNEIESVNTIPTELYTEHDVKRGLRNQDGSGVLAGLTRVSSVVGTGTENGERVPAEGQLKLRGIRLKELIKSFSEESRFCFEYIVFLLLVGRKPTDDEHQAICHYFQAHRAIPDAVVEILKLSPSKSVMNKLQTAVSALYGFDENPDGIEPMDTFHKSLRLIAKFPTIIAYAYLTITKSNPKLVSPSSDLSTAEAFLYMLTEGKQLSQLDNFILDLCLVLHAEHGGGNNSSFTAHVVSSSGSDIYCSIAAAVASLKGPLHGAANQKVRDMMNDIRTQVDDWTNRDEVRDYLSQIILKKAHDRSGKIYGLGHAVYTKSDPRAEVIKDWAKKLAAEKDREDELGLYFAIEEEGPRLFADIKKSTKVISPNVDFFSGFVYDCLGIPLEVYTPMFAMARVAGWCAHRQEELVSGKRIIRPGYKFVSV